MTFEDVKKILSRAIFADNQILIKNGLQQLSEHYVPYPMIQEKTTLCILVKKGLTPKTVAALSESEAKDGKVLVLENTGNTWTKVWPLTASK